MAKIIMIVTNFYPIIGGSEKQAELLSTCLINQGHDVSILTRKHKNWSSNEKFGNLIIHRRRGIPFLGTLSEISTAITFCFFLFKNRKQIDIVHLHQATLLTSISGFFSYHLLKKKVICKIANSGSKFDLFTLENRYKLIGNILRYLIENSVDIFICLNNKILKQFHDLNIFKTVIIPNGVKTSGLIKPKNTNGKFKRIISTSRLTPQKNIETLIFAFSKLIATNKDLKLSIFGDGPSKFLLMDLAVKLKIPDDQIIFHGNVSNVSDYFILGDIFVLPSFVEGMSNSLLEAMSLGIPSVVSNIPENLEVVTDKYDSFVFDPNNSNDLYHNLQLIINSNTLYESLSFNAIKSIEGKYDINYISNNYIKLYNQLLSK